MADEISIGSKAIKEIQDLRAELVKLSQDAISAGKSMSSISTPGGLNKSTESNAKTLQDLETLKAKYASLSDSIVKNAEKSRLAEIRLQQQREKSFDTFDKNVKKEEAALKKAEGAYQRIQNSVTILTKTYNDLAIRKELGNTLTEKEEKQLTSLSTRINTYQDALKKTDSQIGKNQRNVGNYASGYNALGNSINQLSRELPAFGNSLQTGFMAISNNVGAFQDAIMGLRKGGMSWGGIIKEMGASLFGLTGIISLATTLLVTLGPQFIEWLFNTNAEKEALDNLTSSLKRQNDQVKEYNENLTHQNVLAVENAKQRGASTREIQGLERQLAEDQLKNFENNRNLRKKEYEDFVLSEARKIAIAFKGTKWYDTQVELVRKRLLTQNSIQKDAFTQAENDVKAQGNVLSELVEKQQTQLIEESKKKDKKAKRDDIEGIKSHLKTVGTLVHEINSEIERLTVEKITANDAERPAVIEQLRLLLELRNQINGLPDADFEIKTPVKQEQIEKVKELTEAMKNYLKSFSSELAQNAGFTETFEMLNGEIEGFGENWQVTTEAIMQSAQEVFNFITNASKKNFDGEKERLQNQYDVALAFAGDNKAAQEKLALDLEAKKKEIDYREAKAKQQQAIFNIAIDTAQAVVAVLPNFVLAGIVAAFGLAQGIAVASQEIPRYFMGGTHDGGLMMVNDGAGSNFKETIITPDGNIHKPTGRNVIMNAPAGTEIFTHDQWSEQMNNMLKSNGINWNIPQHQQQNGISKNDMKEAMLEAIGEQPQYHTNFNGDGVVNYISKRGNITRQNTNRSNGKGIKF